LAASRFFLAGASAKWRSTALAAAALRLALIQIALAAAPICGQQRAPRW